MRQFFLVVGTGVTLWAQAVPPPPALDQPMGPTVQVEDPSGRDPCHLWIAFEQLARQAQVRIGFEQPSHCGPAPWEVRPFGDSLSLGGLTPRQAFDRVLSHRSDYRWTAIDGVVVVRPATAWAPSGSILDAPVSAFAVTDQHPHHALHAVFESTQPSLFQQHTDLRLSSNSRRLDNPHSTTLIDDPVSVRFAGGNVVQALNAITRGFGGIWQAAYLPRGDGRRSLWVALYTLDADAGVTQLRSAAFPVTPGTPR